MKFLRTKTRVSVRGRHKPIRKAKFTHAFAPAERKRGVLLQVSAGTVSCPWKGARMSVDEDCRKPCPYFGGQYGSVIMCAY